MAQDEKSAMKIREFNRILVIPEPMYAGGMYRVPGEIQVKEWARMHVLRASEEI